MFSFIGICGYSSIKYRITHFGILRSGCSCVHSSLQFSKPHQTYVDTSHHYFIPCIADELMNERDKYKAIADEMDQTFADLAGYWIWLCTNKWLWVIIYVGSWYLAHCNVRSSVCDWDHCLLYMHSLLEFLSLITVRKEFDFYETQSSFYAASIHHK